MIDGAKFELNILRASGGDGQIKIGDVSGLKSILGDRQGVSRAGLKAQKTVRAVAFRVCLLLRTGTCIKNFDGGVSYLRARRIGDFASEGGYVLLSIRLQVKLRTTDRKSDGDHLKCCLSQEKSPIQPQLQHSSAGTRAEQSGDQCR